MKETIIYAPSCNKTELLRSLARFGKNTIGIRIVDSIELIELAMIKKGKFKVFNINTEDECILDIYRNKINIDDNGYFSIAKSIDDASVIYSSLKLIRTNTSEYDFDIFEKLECNDKNNALRSCLELDTISNDLISTIKNVINNEEYSYLNKSISELFILEEFPLNALEKGLADKLAENINKDKKNIKELFLLESKECKKDNIHFAKTYGSSSESEWIISTIVRNQYKFDDCVIAYTDSEYPELFWNLSQVHNIPMTFASGISITNSNPGKLLGRIQHWTGFGYYGIEALKAIINSPSFNKKKFMEDIGLESDNQLKNVIKAAGSLRLSFQKETNDKRIKDWKGIDPEKRISLGRNNNHHEFYTQVVEKLANQLNAGLKNFINEYAIEACELDKKAKNAILERLDLLEKNNVEINDDIYTNILSMKAMQSGLSKGGAVHIVPLEKAHYTLRKHLFICGLTASVYPGKPHGDPLFTDEEIKRINEECESYSTQRIKDKDTLLDKLIEDPEYACSSLYLSYPNYNTEELKSQNPSSKFFELSSGRDVEEIGYFDSGLTLGENNIDSKGNNKDKTDQQECCGKSTIDLKCFDRNVSLSPSAIETYVECPRRFYLQYVERIPNESPDDTVTLIPWLDFGSMVHEIMEEIVDKFRDEEGKNIDALVEEYADDYFKKRIPFSFADVNNSKADLKSVVKAAYSIHQQNKGLSTESKEENISSTFKCWDGNKISLSGYPDRVDKIDQDKYKIIDYKTSRTVKHDPDKLDTFVQIHAYAYIFEQVKKSQVVDSCEFWYPRKGDDGVVNLKWGKASEDNFERIMNDLNDSINNNTFARTPGKDEENCKYCNFKDICKWPGDVDAEEEDC